MSENSRPSRATWLVHGLLLGGPAMVLAVSLLLMGGSMLDTSVGGVEGLLRGANNFGTVMRQVALLTALIGLGLWALISTAILQKWGERPRFAVGLHTGALLVVLGSSALGSLLEAWRHEREARARADQEAAEEKEDARIEACLSLTHLVVHTGGPRLRADVELDAQGCAVTVTAITVEGGGSGYAWISLDRDVRLESEPSTVHLDDDDPTPEDAGALHWSVEVEFEASSSGHTRLFCGPGAVSSSPEYKPCQKLGRLDVIAD